MKCPFSDRKAQKQTTGRIFIMGMDGASMELVLNMIDWGHMPNLAQLKEQYFLLPAQCPTFRLKFQNCVEIQLDPVLDWPWQTAAKFR